MADDVRIANGKGGRPQVREQRRDGWTDRKRGLFLDHLAATCNIRRSAAAAGMPEHGVYALRRRDPEFAEQWWAAIDASRARLESLAIEHAGGSSVPIGETEIADPPAFDLDKTLRVLAYHRARSAGPPPRRSGPKLRRADESETDAAILKGLKALRKRLGPS